MKTIFTSFPIALNAILKDPINVILAIIPTLLALALYVITVVGIFMNADYFGVVIQEYIPDPKVAGWVGKLITALFIIFVFLIMSWTFVLFVGIISAPFNSMLSGRIERMLTGQTLGQSKQQTFKEILFSFGRTFKDEFQKLIFILLLSIVAMILNIFPLFYPVGLLVLALLLAVQFVDYSWSRHELRFGSCLKDVSKNIFPYATSGLFFLVLVSVPVINAFVPALATSYFTVLWLNRQKKLIP